MKENGIFVSSYELGLLVNRLDSNKDGKITFNEVFYLFNF